jgi:cytochrome c biogenesis protein CcdA
MLAVVSIVVGAQLVVGQKEEAIEHAAAFGLIAFGLGYAVWAYFRHSDCHGHTHHGPHPRGERAPMFFLFSLGLSPCVAVLPVFAAAAAHGVLWVVLAMIAFSVGVLTALVGSTLVVRLGVLKLDHPILEHYADVITGLGVAMMGLVLALLAHS